MNYFDALSKHYLVLCGESLAGKYSGQMFIVVVYQGLHISQEEFWNTPFCRFSPNPYGSEAVAWQLKASGLYTDFL